MSNITYKVCTLDVWGNSEDGYEVNDQFAAGSIELSPEMSDAEILQKLADEGYLTENAVDCGEIDTSDESFMTVHDKADGRPVLNLFAEE
jgi:hypothetical protein